MGNGEKKIVLLLFSNYSIYFSIKCSGYMYIKIAFILCTYIYPYRLYLSHTLKPYNRNSSRFVNCYILLRFLLGVIK